MPDTFYYLQPAAEAIAAMNALADAVGGGASGFVTSVNGVEPVSGDVTLTKDDLDLGNVQNKSSATIRSEITSGNVEDALGYLPLPPSYIPTWASISGKPTFATVATTGAYSDLTGTPSAYSLPTASPSVLGGVKVGTGLAIDGAGVLSSTIVGGITALLGDVTASGSGSVTATIGPNKVNLAMLAQVANDVFLGRDSSGTGNVEAIPVADVKTMLGLGTAAYTNTGAYAPAAHVGAGGSEHPAAVAGGAAGFITGSDQTKLNAITGTNTGDQPTFLTIQVAGETDIIADDEEDVLTFVAGTNMSIDLNPATKEITLNATGGGGASIQVLDEGGAPITITLASLNFVGAGVAATAIGDDVTITISGAGLTNTDDLIEGDDNLYFTEDRVLDSVLVGLSLVTTTPITAANTVLEALGRLQAQVTANAVAASAYADSLVVGLLDDRGNHDASGNTYPSTGGSGAAGAILKGDLWTISVAGTIGGHPVTPGDFIRALVDTPGTTDSNWAIAENNLGYVAENSANKVTSLSGASTDTQYPSAKLTYDQLALKANASAPTIVGGSITALTSFGIRSTGAAFDLIMATSEVLTANRTLSWNLADAARSITLAGNLNFAASFTTSGAFASTFTMTGVTAVTFPTSGTLLSSATAVTPAQGGTGIVTFTSGDLLYASGTTTLSKLAAAASGNVLLSGAAPSWGKVPLTSHISGILPSANGGTGVDNGGRTATLAGNLTTVGAFASTFTMTGVTALTFPTSGTLATTTDAQAFKTIVVAGQSDIVADQVGDTLTIVGVGLEVTTNAATDTLTLTVTSSGSVLPLYYLDLI